MATREVLDQAAEIQDVKSQEAINLYLSIVSAAGTDEESRAIKEEAIYKLGDLYAKLGRASDISDLLKIARPFFADLPKAKTAKIVRTVIDYVGRIPGTLGLQIDLCVECIEWTKQEKRTFLRQRIQTRLAALYFERKDFQSALQLLNVLLREVRRLDDKALLVEIQLLESRVQLSLRNIPKAKAALTGARSAATSIYCPPLLQAQLDMQSGVLHAEEKDYKTAYSYFFEGFEAFNVLNDAAAVLCLKYMLLCKIMTNSSEDVASILSGKNALRYQQASSEVEAMRAVARAHSLRTLDEFTNALQSYKKELTDDPIIESHLNDLYDNLLEQHLTRLIEPFSRVQIVHVSKLINLPLETVERKLSQMILDKKLNGILDQGLGCLIVFDQKKENKMYPAALHTMENMSLVVDSLFERARKLT